MSAMPGLPSTIVLTLAGMVITLASSTSTSILSFAAAALADHDYRPGMKNVKNRVLYMCGEKDGGNTAVMRTMKQEFPAAQYVELADAGHISNMDRPAEFSRALREFLTA